MASRSKAERRWRGIVSDWRVSGLTQAQYCRRHGLSETSFSHWKRRLQPEISPGVDATNVGEFLVGSVASVGLGLAEVKVVDPIAGKRDDSAGGDHSPTPPVYPLDVELRRNHTVLLRWSEGIEPSVLDRLLLWLERTAC